jgi:hypothetical protein
MVGTGAFRQGVSALSNGTLSSFVENAGRFATDGAKRHTKATSNLFTQLQQSPGVQSAKKLNENVSGGVKFARNFGSTLSEYGEHSEKAAFRRLDERVLRPAYDSAMNQPMVRRVRKVVDDGITRQDSMFKKLTEPAWNAALEVLPERHANTLAKATTDYLQVPPDHRFVSDSHDQQIAEFAGNVFAHASGNPGLAEPIQKTVGFMQGMEPFVKSLLRSSRNTTGH